MHIEDIRKATSLDNDNSRQHIESNRHNSEQRSCGTVVVSQHQNDQEDPNNSKKHKISNVKSMAEDPRFLVRLKNMNVISNCHL